MNEFPLLAIALAWTLHHPAWAAGADGSASDNAVQTAQVNPNLAQASNMKIRLTLNGQAVTGSLIDSPTTRDFISLLPLSLTMGDLFGREKFAQLPRAISTEGKRSHTYEVGDIALWSPGPDVAIFYRQDGQRTPSPGLIVLGRIESGVEALNSPGNAKVTIELLK